MAQQSGLGGWLKGLFAKSRAETAPIGADLDPDVRSVLEELGMEVYIDTFAHEGIRYEDLPELIPHLDDIIPDPEVNKLLRDYIEKNFVSTKLLLDPSRVLEVGDEISRGAFGSIRVGKVQAGISELTVAIKEIVLDGTTTTRGTVVAEVEIMEKLRHKNLLKCFGCYFSEGQDIGYIVVEYCPRGDLKKYRAAHPEMPWETKLHFLLQLCQAMSYMHDKNYMHFDLKIQNVLLADDAAGPRLGIRVCDFGETCKRGACENHLIGTPAYLAPEQCTGSPIPPEMEDRVDIYAFGFLCYELWTGKVPFEALSRQFPQLKPFVQAVHGGPEPVRPDLDAELVDATEALKQIIRDCWAADPEERPDSFESIEQDLLMAKADFKRDLAAEEERRKRLGGGGGGRGASTTTTTGGAASAARSVGAVHPAGTAAVGGRGGAPAVVAPAVSAGDAATAAAYAQQYAQYDPSAYYGAQQGGAVAASQQQQYGGYEPSAAAQYDASAAAPAGAGQYDAAAAEAYQRQCEQYYAQQYQQQQQQGYWPAGGTGDQVSQQ